MVEVMYRAVSNVALFVGVFVVLGGWGTAVWFVDSSIPGDTLGARVSAVPNVYTALLGGSAALSAAFIAFLAAQIKVIQDGYHAWVDHRARVHNALLLADYVARKTLEKIDGVIVRTKQREIFIIDDESGNELIEAKRLQWLRLETPYLLGKLWENIGVLPVRISNSIRELTIHLEATQEIVSREKTDDGVDLIIDRTELLAGLNSLRSAARSITVDCNSHLR